MLGGITSSTTNVVPLPLRGEGLNARESGEDFMSRALLFHIPASETLPDRERVLLFPSAGGAKPIAGRGGLEGFTPPHH